MAFCSSPGSLLFARMHRIAFGFLSAFFFLAQSFAVYEGIWQPVVNREKSHDRTERPDIKRDTCHELERRSSQRRSSDARQLGCVFQDLTPPKSILRKSSDIQEKEDESGRRLCEYWSAIFQARVEGSSTITLRPSCDTSRKLVTTRVGKSTETKLNELILPQRRNPLLVPMGLAFTGVRADWVRSFSSTHTNISWRVAQSLCHLPKAELCFPSPPTSTTMEGS